MKKAVFSTLAAVVLAVTFTSCGAAGVAMNILFPEAQLIGTWEGSYTANQGETGLTLTVYREGSDYKASFDFYNLPGRNNAQRGKYLMNVTYNETTKTYQLRGYEWVNRPGGYTYIDLEGTISGNVFSGRVINSSSWTFRVVKK